MKFFWKDKQFTKSVIMLGIPIALQNLISAVLNIFDQVMTGWLPPEVADNCLSAVMLVNQVVLIYGMVIFAIANTVNIFIAQYTNDIHKKLIPQRVGLALSMALVTGIVFTIVCVVFNTHVMSLFNAQEQYRVLAEEFLSVVGWSYIPMAISTTIGFVLRAIKRMREVLIANVIGVACNIVFNYVLMFGVGEVIPAYGFIGAAYGTIIARVLEMFIIIIALVKYKYPIIAKPSVMFRRDPVFNRKFVKLFIPILINEVSWALSTAVQLYVFDKQPNSEVVLAAYNITSTIDRLITVFMMGVGSAACIVLGNVMAENNTSKTMSTAKYSVQFSALVGLILGIITFGIAFVAPKLFVNASAEAQSMATNMTIIFGIGAVVRSTTFMLLVGVLRSGGDSTFCMLVETITIWALLTPLLCVGGLVLGWNIYILLALIMMFEVLKTAVCMWRIRGTKWIRILA